MQPAMCIRRPVVAASTGKPIANTPVVKAPRGIAATEKRVAVAIPGILGPVGAAWAGELADSAQQGVETGRQALSASQVPQWSQVQIPKGLQAPDVGNVLGSSGVNPLLLLGAVAAVAVPALLFQVLNPGSKAKSSSAANVVAALTEEPRTVLLDIRASAAAKAAGTPDLKATKRRAVTLPFTRVGRDGSEEAVDGWAARAARQLKPDSIVILLDEDGKTAPKAAAQLDSDSFDDLFFVAGGADAWEASGQAWRAPGRGLGLDLSGLQQSLGQSLGTLRIKAGQTISSGSVSGSGGGQVAPTTVLAGAGAVLGAVLLLNQTGVFLEVVGLGAAANWAYKNVFFAEDRKRTTSRIQKLLDEDIKTGEAGSDIKRLTSALLEGGEDVAAATDRTLERKTGDLKGKAKEVAGKVEGEAKGVSEKVEGKAKGVSEKVESKANGVSGKVKGKADEAAQEVQGAAKTVDKKTPDSVDEAADEAAKKAEQAKGEARGWVENWKSKNKSNA